jgi:two-component system response regulator AtoC
MSQVLLVDDDPLMRELLAEWLGEAGYRVRQADNGASALQMLSSQPAGVLITDMDMPGRDGAQMLAEVLRTWPDMPVIAISGGARDGKANWAATAIKLGAGKTLDKPFEKRQLLSAVKDILATGPARTSRP